MTAGRALQRARTAGSKRAERATSLGPLEFARLSAFQAPAAIWLAQSAAASLEASKSGPSRLEARRALWQREERFSALARPAQSVRSEQPRSGRAEPLNARWLARGAAWPARSGRKRHKHVKGALGQREERFGAPTRRDHSEFSARPRSQSEYKRKPLEFARLSAQIGSDL